MNLLSRSIKTKYDKQMFESRRIVYRNGFFQPLIAKLGERIINQLPSKSERIKVLDAGCGEGSLLSSIQEKVAGESAIDLLAVGMDLSKEAIYAASRQYANGIWCVADIAKPPFAGEQFHFILSVLSPSHYDQFQRLLADDGLVIKVIPESGYLQELREIFYGQTERQVYSNKSTLARFRNNFALVDIQRLQYHVTLDSSLVQHLVQMTPLSWGTTEERVQKVLAMKEAGITVDLTILIGAKI